MPSDRRLHPLSFLFAIAGQLRQFLIPGLVVLFTAGAASGEWEPWLTVMVIPIALGAFVRSLSYRYRLDEADLVVRTGFVFRKERHIPYARIQNIEAIQTVVHRLFRVIEIRIETGAGKEDDATMRVVPVAAYEEIRACVQAKRPDAAIAVPPDAAPDAEPDAAVVLRLPPRELILSGFVDNRSAVLIAASFGAIWELGLFDRAAGLFFTDAVTGRSLVRQTLRTVFGGGTPSLQTIGLTLAAVAILFAAATALSMIWAYVRLHGFVLRRAGDELRAEYGLFTRIATTIPLRRIQTLTIFEGPLHRAFGRAAVRVETAGADAQEQGASGREPLAPIIPRGELLRLVEHVLPGVRMAELDWQPAAPGAFWRELRKSAVASLAITLVLAQAFGWWALGGLAGLLAFSALRARRYADSLGWAAASGAIWFRRGWLWRRLTVARFSKIQIVALHRSPFDRRLNMARLRVDTAGAARESDRIDIPYIQAAVAQELHQRLAVEASGTTFQW